MGPYCLACVRVEFRASPWHNLAAVPPFSVVVNEYTRILSAVPWHYSQMYTPDMRYPHLTALAPGLSSSNSSAHGTSVLLILEVINTL